MKLNENAGILITEDSAQKRNSEGNQVGLIPGDTKVHQFPEKGDRYDGISSDETIWRVPEETTEKVKE